MNTLMHQLPPKTSRSTCWISSVFAFGVGLGLFITDPYAIAQETDVPWECSEYSGEARTRCMNTLLGLQQEKIARLEEKLKAQEGTVNELKEKMDRQEALARRDAQAYKQDPRYPPTPYLPSYAPPHVLPYGYAPLPPIGIYLQPPWRVPRFYGYGPGYGPGYWGAPGFGLNFRFGGGHKHRHR